MYLINKIILSNIIKQKYFTQNTKDVAKDLLGKKLIRKINGEKIDLNIKETEAYIGPEDKASHAHGGQTERNKVMFGSAGYWYIYLIYGIHHMLNIVTEQSGYPAAVLIRAAGGYDGPGKLTKALEIDKKFDSIKATKSNKLWIEDSKKNIPSKQIEATPRIGVDYAEEWADKHLRFVLKE